MTNNTGSAASVYIVGAGGLGRETLDALFALGRTVDELALVDDHPCAVEIHGVPVRRPEEVTRGGRYVVAVGDPAVRRALSQRLLDRGLLPTSVVHPRATLAHDVTVPNGCLILANAFVSTNVRLGAPTQRAGRVRHRPSWSERRRRRRAAPGRHSRQQRVRPTGTDHRRADIHRRGRCGDQTSPRRPVSGRRTGQTPCVLFKRVIHNGVRGWVVEVVACPTARAGLRAATAAYPPGRSCE